MIDANVLRELADASSRQSAYPNAMFPPSIYYRFLRLLTGWMKPKCSVELGLCGGGASLHMALGYPEGVVIGIDIENVYPECILHVIETCPNFEFWQMDSVDAADHAVLSWLGTTIAPDDDLHIISILFIDTLHTYEQTMAEFTAWKHLLTPDAVVVLDDLFRPGMDRVWRELPGEKMRLDVLHIGGTPIDGGFGVVYNI